MNLLAAMLAIALALAIPGQADARNTPCSGSKGGVSHCEGDTFVCNDGSISASKKSCQAYMGGATQLVPKKPAPAAVGDCSCRSGTYCTGPRGGTYCHTDSGRKSYKRR